MSEREVSFSVDAQLLRELGERLVGRPHIALSELIKNAYDADATVVEIDASPERIVITDNGHGMTYDEFADTWMRVGSVHKASQRISRRKERELTGSKGVGRLAVQLLSRETEIVTVGDTQGRHEKVTARIDWDRAVRQGDLTSVKVPVTTQRADGYRFPEGSTTGTHIELRRLTGLWTAEDFSDLAQEIWMLQPPYQAEGDSPDNFRIVFGSQMQDAYDAFTSQMKALLEIWTARLTGELVDANSYRGRIAGDLPMRLTQLENITSSILSEGTDPDTQPSDRLVELLPDKVLKIKVHLRGQPPTKVALRVHQCPVNKMRFDIRIFNLQGRQPKNIKVSDARKYLNRFGGIGVYDGVFRLPYYGPEQDWIELEEAHAARRSTSSLLPDELNVSRGLQNLPTNRRVYGRVIVSTADEARWYRQREQIRSQSDTVMERPLTNQITRDRLVPNNAYERLRVMARTVMDLYAMETTRRRHEDNRDKRRENPEPPSELLSEISTAVQEASPHLPAATYRDITAKVQVAARSVQALEEQTREHSALLGALATAGITAMAYNHELSRQTAQLARIVEQLRQIATTVPKSQHTAMLTAIDGIQGWLDRAKGLRQLLQPVMDEESRKDRRQYKACTVLQDVATNLEPLSRGTPIDTNGVPTTLQLPSATIAGWWAVFQNLFINSFNALLQREDGAVISVDGGTTDSHHWLRVQDNGVGVGNDLDEANRLWAPFARNLTLPPEIVGLGLGGTGLGLTIVRMILDEVHARAEFTRPSDGFMTAVTIRWSER